MLYISVHIGKFGMEYQKTIGTNSKTGRLNNCAITCCDEWHILKRKISHGIVSPM